MKSVKLISAKDFKNFCTERLGSEPSRQEERMIDFLHYQITDACKKSIFDERLQLAGMLFLTTSEIQAQCNHGLTRPTFGGDPKRNVLARTIKAFYNLDRKGLDEIIGEVAGFQKISFCKDDRMEGIKNCCVDAAKILVQDIYKLFDEEERKTWLTGLPAITPAANAQSFLTECEHPQTIFNNNAALHLASGTVIIGSEEVQMNGGGEPQSKKQKTGSGR